MGLPGLCYSLEVLHNSDSRVTYSGYCRARRRKPSSAHSRRAEIRSKPERVGAACISNLPGSCWIDNSLSLPLSSSRRRQEASVRASAEAPAHTISFPAGAKPAWPRIQVQNLPSRWKKAARIKKLPPVPLSEQPAPLSPLAVQPFERPPLLLPVGQAVAASG